MAKIKNLNKNPLDNGFGLKRGFLLPRPKFVLYIMSSLCGVTFICNSINLYIVYKGYSSYMYFAKAKYHFANKLVFGDQNILLINQ